MASVCTASAALSGWCHLRAQPGTGLLAYEASIQLEAMFSPASVAERQQRSYQRPSVLKQLACGDLLEAQLQNVQRLRQRVLFQQLVSGNGGRSRSGDGDAGCLCTMVMACCSVDLSGSPCFS